MTLETTYLGLELQHPFVMGASPLTADLDRARAVEDGGAAALVLPSLFEEQITLARHGHVHHMDPFSADFRETVADFPDADRYRTDPDEYLEHVRRLKAAVRIPVIASLNGSSAEAWLEFGRDLEQAGADALEVNFYDPVADMGRSALSVEAEIEAMVKSLKHILRIPVAVKLRPFFTAIGNVAQRLDRAGADGLVLFNRLYGPDIDPETVTVQPHLALSSSDELQLRLTWTAMLAGRLRASLAITGGVATVSDGAKAILAGADAVQVVSAILRNGPTYFATLRDGLSRWGEEHGAAHLSEMRGRLSLAKAADPDRWQRAHYIQTLQSWSR